MLQLFCNYVTNFFCNAKNLVLNSLEKLINLFNLFSDHLCPELGGESFCITLKF